MKIFAYGIRNDEKPALEDWKSAHPEVEVDYTQELLTPEQPLWLRGQIQWLFSQQLDYTPETFEGIGRSWCDKHVFA